MIPITGADGTALGEGIISALNHLKAGAAKTKIIILLTDGRGNVGLDAATAAKTAAAMGVKIYAIGTAKRGESVMPLDDPNLGRVMVRVSEDLDEDTLLEVARITNGKYWRATSLKELRSIYAEIDRLYDEEVSACMNGWNNFCVCSVVSPMPVSLISKRSLISPRACTSDCTRTS